MRTLWDCTGFLVPEKLLETKRLQTLPDDLIHGAWVEAMRQLGNAVPVRLAEVIGRQLSSVLKVDDPAVVKLEPVQL
jgi:C-5 cytosine-specific DNA methylase